MERFSSPNRRLAQVTSSLDESMPDAFGEFFPASGSDGCESTGATTLGSVIIANAKPPVKHIPTAPTPRPPHS
jgi:hypothetical protein